MKSKLWKLLLALAVCFTMVTQGYAKVEWDILKTLKVDETPLDVTVSPDGRYVFVLIEGGNILVYLANGTLTDKIDIGRQIDQVTIGPKGEHLFVTSRKNKSVEIVRLDFIKSINISGSPFKGPQDAPIVLAVFGDFE
jgi:DNA-binding beta-propeller fold protein YncE